MSDISGVVTAEAPAALSMSSATLGHLGICANVETVLKVAVCGYGSIRVPLWPDGIPDTGVYVWRLDGKAFVLGRLVGCDDSTYPVTVELEERIRQSPQRGLRVIVAGRYWHTVPEGAVGFRLYIVRELHNSRVVQGDAAVRGPPKFYFNGCREGGDSMPYAAAGK